MFGGDVSVACPHDGAIKHVRGEERQSAEHSEIGEEWSWICEALGDERMELGGESDEDPDEGCMNDRGEHSGRGSAVGPHVLEQVAVEQPEERAHRQVNHEPKPERGSSWLEACECTEDDFDADRQSRRPDRGREQADRRCSKNAEKDGSARSHGLLGLRLRACTERATVPPRMFAPTEDVSKIESLFIPQPYPTGFFGCGCGGPELLDTLANETPSMPMTRPCRAVAKLRFAG